MLHGVLRGGAVQDSRVGNTASANAQCKMHNAQCQTNFRIVHCGMCIVNMQYLGHLKMAVDGGRGLRESGFLAEAVARECPRGSSRSPRPRRSGRRASARIRGVDLVELLDVLDDVGHLRRVKLDLGVGDLEMGKFCDLSYVHKITEVKGQVQSKISSSY